MSVLVRICISHRGRVFKFSLNFLRPYTRHTWTTEFGVRKRTKFCFWHRRREHLSHTEQEACFFYFIAERTEFILLYIFVSVPFATYSPVHRPKNFMLLHAPLQNHKKISLVKLKIMKLVLAGWFFCRKKSYRVVRCKVFFCISFPPHCKMQETTIFLYCVVSCFVSLEVFNLIVRHRLFSAFNLN